MLSAGRHGAAGANYGVNDTFGPQHQRLQQPLLQFSQTGLINAIAASFRHFPRDLFAGNGVGCICQKGLQVQVSQQLHTLLHVLKLLQLGASCLSPRTPANNPKRNVQSKQGADARESAKR